MPDQSKISSFFHSKVFVLILYGLLLVLTPFIMLQNFLQEFIGSFSRISIGSIPLIVVFFVAAIGIFFAFFREITIKYKLLMLITGIVLILLSQQITDFYLNKPFYDLQQNWHYLAYAIFAILMWDYLRDKRDSLSSIIVITFIVAMTLSTFDEGFQFFISSRVFDISDIAKDGWGVIIGFSVLLFFYRFHSTQKLKPAVKNLVLVGIFDFLLLVFSSLLSDIRYSLHVIILTIVCFSIFFLIRILARNRIIRIGLITILISVIMIAIINVSIHKNDNISLCRKNLLIYRGIPLVGFDYMIFPNGTFRPVDKKESFSGGDRLKIYEYKPRIVIIGTGNKGIGGKGFGDDEIEFKYNPLAMEGVQIIRQKNPQACQTFNRLKKEGKTDVLFVIHNSWR